MEGGSGGSGGTSSPVPTKKRRVSRRLRVAEEEGNDDVEVAEVQEEEPYHRQRGLQVFESNSDNVHIAAAMEVDNAPAFGRPVNVNTRPSSPALGNGNGNDNEERVEVLDAVPISPALNQLPSASAGASMMSLAVAGPSSSSGAGGSNVNREAVTLRDFYRRECERRAGASTPPGGASLSLELVEGMPDQINLTIGQGQGLELQVAVAHPPLPPLHGHGRVQQMQILPASAGTSQGRGDEQGWQESRFMLKDRAHYLLNNPRMSDIRFVVGDAKVDMFGHKTLLAMGSPVFEAQFFGSLKSSDEVIELPDFDPQTFLLFLKYLYTDTLDEPLDDVKVLHLLRPAKKYIVPHLIEKCSDILMSELKPENVFQIKTYADFFDLPKLCGACLRFIDRESEAIVQTEEFTMLNLETLASFIVRDGLNIGEIDLFKALLRWAEVECERNNVEPIDVNIRQALSNNLQLIRFPTMNAEDFATDVAPRGILTAEEARSIFIYMCTGYHNRGNPAFLPTFPIKKRNFQPQQYLVSRFGGEPTPHSLNYRSGEIYTYRFNVKADRQIFFKGVNIFSIKCGVNAQYVDQRRFNGAVYLYECDNGDRDLNREKARKQFTRDGSLESELETSSGSRYFPVIMDNEVRIPANQMVTVCAAVSVASSSYQQQPLNTFMGTDEVTEVSVRCAEDLIINFAFSNCNGETSVGKYTQSQIPEIIFSL